MTQINPPYTPASAGPNPILFIGFLAWLMCAMSPAQAADFAISASKSKGGNIVPAGKTTVTEGSSKDFTATANPGYYLAELKVDGKPVSLSGHDSASYTFDNVMAAHKIAAKFSKNPVITAKANTGGSITPSGKTSVAYGGNQTYAIAANTGFHLTAVNVDGVAKGAVSSQSFTGVTSNHSLSAKFAIDTYQLSTELGSNGSISPKQATVKYGANKTFTITPNKGFQIANVAVNGVAQSNLPSAGKYKLVLKAIAKDTVITASFIAKAAGKVSGLKVGTQVSVVDAQENLSQNAPLQAQAAIIQEAPVSSSIPANADYFKDKTNIYVNEKAGEAFKTVNMILCMIAQTKYSDEQLLNQGYYKAMVDSGVCEGNDSADNSGSSAQAGTSAGAATVYDTWVAKSERSSDTSKQTLSAYVHMAQSGKDDGPMTVQAKVEVTEAASEENPLGIFSINYQGVMDSNPSIPVMKGLLKTEKSQNNVLIRFAEQEGPEASPMRVAKAAYTKNDTTNTGQGSAYQQENYGQQNKAVNINFAYNANFFKRVDPADGQGPCLNRNQFETSAWRYGIYDASTGQRASINGGFPINTQADGMGANGYLSYYGLNLPPNAPALADGDKIYKTVWENGSRSTTPYTLAIKGGKLKKHTRSSITLEDIKNIPLEGSLPAPGSMNAGNNMIRVSWDGTALAIRASATMSQNGPPAWNDLVPPTPIDNTYTLPFSNLGLYSQALGGQVNIQLANCQPLQQNNPGSGFKCDTPSSNTAVIFYKENTVSPGDIVPASLSCYENCPKAGNNGMDGSSQQAMTYPQSFDPGANNHHDYSFTDMLLRDGNNGVVLTTAPASQSWGFNSGPLFELSQANIAQLACDWNPNQTCGWKAWNALDVFYTWETGPNTWNKYTSVKDANNNFVAFEPPWQVAYTYPVDGTNGTNRAETDNKYKGSKFFLQYSGFGDLQGIPGKCVNPADPSQAVTDCSQPGFRWVPEFTIPADSIVKVGNVDYLAKPLDMEQRMSKAPGSCTDLNPVDMSKQWPSVQKDWVNPNLPAEPVLNEPPKVIGGVIQ